MVDQALARRYAEAFVNAAERTGALQARLQELAGCAQAYRGSSELQRFFGSPEIALGEKEKLFHRVWSEAVGREVLSLLNLVLSWDRIESLPAIAEEAQALAEQRQGILRGRVITAHPISAAETESIAQRVGRLLEKRLVLERAVDPALLGGVRVIVGSLSLDGSVQAALEELRRQLKAAKVN